MPNRKVSLTEVLSRFKAAHGDRYDYTNLCYKGQTTKVLVRCKTHGDFSLYPSNHTKGDGCPDCTNRGMSLFQSSKEFRTYLLDKYGDTIKVSKKTKYRGMNSSTTLVCSKHEKEVTQKVRTLLKGNFKCVDCKNEAFVKSYESKQKGLQVLTKKAKDRRAHVEVRCDTHGTFSTTLASVAKGCSKCIKQARQQLWLENQLITCANVHKNKYDYSKATLTSYLETGKIKIKCPVHGYFKQQLSTHKLRGHQCKKCSGLQNPAVFHAWKSAMYAFKVVLLPDGRKIQVQGDELHGINHLLDSNVKCRHLRFDEDVPSLYYVYDGKRRTYYPDLRYKKTLVEVKSTFTWAKDKLRNKAKLQSALDAGYSIRLLIFDGNKKCVRDETRWPIPRVSRK